MGFWSKLQHDVGVGLQDTVGKAMHSRTFRHDLETGIDEAWKANTGYDPNLTQYDPANRQQGRGDGGGVQGGNASGLFAASFSPLKIFAIVGAVILAGWLLLSRGRSE